ncbi:T9SS type A sorting domain-containing protein [Winogradskyella sp. UBA3174]|uniref:T9SS type A sorting domain-containing protein n=1 Tax=Winogradskyella sp. UBA3174 TaxID=1947785 RepID=UPI0025DA0539|nr:T9SS type A sorting domain-containing protein [Winogradskyella sp. UBA3174]
MKKNLLFTILAFCCITFGFSQADCASALALTPGTPQAGDSTGQPGSFDGGGAAPANPCNGNYNDDEYWFEYTATETGETLQLDMTDITQTWAGIFVLDNCPDTAPNCVVSAENTGATADLSVTTPELVAGTSYKIVISNWGTPNNTAFTLTSTVIPALTCTSAVVDSETVVDDCANSLFTIDVVVSGVGDGTVINDGTSTYPIVAGTLTVGPYTIGDVITLTAEHSDSACDFAIGTYSSGCPPPNDECAGAIAIACAGTYVGDTTAASPEAVDPGTCGTTAGTAGAVWFTFTGANSNDAGAAIGTVGDDVTLDLTGSAFDTKIRVFEGSCAALVCVDGDDDGGAGTTSLLTLPGTLVGTEYYVLVHGFNANVGAYTLAVSCVPPPFCTGTVIDSSTIVETCDPDGTGTFVVEHVVSVAGDAGTVLDDGVNAAVAVTVGTVTTGPYNSGDSVTVELTGPDAACDFTVGTFTFTCPPPPPANDDCASAVALTPGALYTDNPSDGTLVGATDSGFTNSCGGAWTNDVWYTVVVPASGDLTIETGADVATGTTGNDTAMEVYTSDTDCTGVFTSVECDDDDAATGAYSFMELTGLTAGETLYIRVWGFGDDEFEPFSISAFSASLSVDTLENQAAFTYFPNPVKNTLTLNAQNSIENVTMYNMLGQEVLRATPNTVDSELDMSNLQTGTYFVKVTIANVTKTIRVIKQ